MKIPNPEALKASSVPAKRKPLYKSLFFQILIAVVAGVLIGHFWPDLGSQLRPLGDGFIKLIKMIIAPLIFLVIVTGISAVGDVKAVGRVGVKALVYFTAATLFALLFGLVVGNVVQPGAGLNIDPATLSQADLDAKTGSAAPKDAASFILDVIPASVIGAFASNSLLQVLFFSVFFGAAIVVIGRERCMPVISLMETVLELIFKIMSWIMKVAPIGAFGAMAFIIGQYGLSTLSTYAVLIAACYGAAVVFIGLLFAVAWLTARVPLWQFLKYTREEFLLALGTASTEAVMPRIMTKLTNAGCSRATTGLVVPTGYSFNLDGAAIYLSISLLFLAQAFGHNLDLGQQLAALGVLLLTSKGMAGVPGSSFLALSATAAALGIFPVAGVALLLGADRLMDSMRVVVNLLGNCVATFVVSKWEGQFDRSVMVRAFKGEITNHDSAVMLGKEEDFQDQELQRISEGQEPSPKFRGGPNPGDIPRFQMSKSTQAGTGSSPE
ncbi:sodium:dicarboxylate symporter [Pseudarthrobacter chlorophenolicus A6]|uniref:Sodium:dicarboxylate symporter n=1 Tax=Pseudarthrobacter chlorophenolicus (strain ATCC 700700 / DSM 12829 / CIP 107037 / JCM 12360 / KCTC 9906 / NCIMB 13794 / A6) TaxID=452863 RepID=B8HH89_PSECP|nr:C4-dicarboxylate transporter DctA [Pseudarthrobacter chlorophenolicus]ACL41380.1 sodium:dicarboxylate symporter [Pseudarthrobacter chlorophenolicus A6]SDQ65172.1 aerobic C4-dicarboxylate transport protein [Pseudarthrobacter chlorophenolicus]